jgi:hypothetical protein
MDAEALATIVGSLAWPVTIAVLLILYRRSVGSLLKNIEEFRGPGGIHVALRDIKEKVETVEAATRNLSVDIYRVSGDALHVREEIWSYVAGVLKEVSPETRTEMQAKLTKFHLPSLGMTLAEIKQCLVTLGHSWSEESARAQFTDDVSPEFCRAVFHFQSECDMPAADGILGPKTVEELRRRCGQIESSSPDSIGP